MNHSKLYSRLREPPGAVERCSRSSFGDDDGRMQGGKNTATCGSEFQMVNKIAVGMGNSTSGSVLALTTKKVSKDYSSSMTTIGVYFCITNL